MVAPTSQPWAGPPETPRDPSASSVSQDTPSAGLFDDDLDGLADRMDEAHVCSMCTEAKDDAKTKESQCDPIPFCRNGIGLVGPVGFEPTTYGLKERPNTVGKVRDPPFRAWLVDAG